MMRNVPPAERDKVLLALFDANPDGVLIVGVDGRIVMANARASHLLGYSHDELLSMSVDALVPEAVRPHHARYRADFASAPRPRPMGTQLELRARRRDGSELLVEIALAPLQPHGLPYVMAAIRSIGDYPRVKRSLRRARYAECVAQMGRLAVDSRDPQVLLLRAPAAAAEALEADAAQLYVLEHDGRSFRVAGGVNLPADEPVGTLVPNRPDAPPGHLLAHGRPVVVDDYATETRFKVPPSFLAAGLTSALGVPISDRGRTVGALAVRSRHREHFGDDDVRFMESLSSLIATVLQRSASEEALRHSQRLEAVGQLTGGIAHDFNNLLTVIQGNLQVLADLPSLEGNDDVQSLVDAAWRASRRGADLTAKLLAFSRRQVLQPRPIEPARFLPSLADLLRRTLDARIRIAVQIDPDCPPCLADPAQLESALLNLAINSRDAMPGGGELTFRARGCAVPPVPQPLDWPHGGVELAVDDSGVGMSEAVLARAFEPFFTTKEAGRGTGLGLATVYGFAHQSKGAVALVSQPGEGTTVSLYLPSPKLTAVEAALDPSRGKSTVPKGLSVLLVEDEPEVLRVVQAFLRGWDCRVTVSTHADAALAELASGSTAFDLLLSDVVLGPGLRGTELAQRARELRPGLPVLLMSGYAYGAGEAPGLPLLRKPFTREELAQSIRQALVTAG